jgi:hypothetical protein
VPDEVHIAARAKRPAIRGVVTVIGQGGLFIRTRSSQTHGTVLHLELTEPFGKIELDGTVRNLAENGLGLEITSITAANEQKLRDLLLRLKR